MPMMSLEEIINQMVKNHHTLANNQKAILDNQMALNKKLDKILALLESEE